MTSKDFLSEEIIIADKVSPIIEFDKSREESKSSSNTTAATCKKYLK